MSHTVKTTVITSATGQISGYGFCIEAENNGAPEEIAACIIASLDILRATIITAFAPTDVSRVEDRNPPPGYAPAVPPEHVEGQPPADLQRTGVLPTPSAASTPSTQPPATAEEAEQRFYIRYGEIIGGSSWADVRRYLKEPRRLAPATVEQWIATAKAVQTISQAQATAAGVAQRQYARH
ncbi:MAG: hypothetical protein M3R61_00515 [Chloroflexota bacterium]|nr:hypothetical protein [Chloroflexota bacterium]